MLILQSANISAIDAPISNISIFYPASMMSSPSSEAPSAVPIPVVYYLSSETLDVNRNFINLMNTQEERQALIVPALQSQASMKLSIATGTRGHIREAVDDHAILLHISCDIPRCGGPLLENTNLQTNMMTAHLAHCWMNALEMMS